MKVAFLDRDGTIIEDYEDHAWSVVEKPIFLPKAIEGLKKIRESGYEIIIITNQYLIGENIITIEQYHKITALMLDELRRHGVEIFDIFFCPHSRNTNCQCRKPKTGMIDAALKKYPTIYLPSSFLAGDHVI
jgi:D-glycero-D-manno-heptose 1,7-bisphosphate phosphatase